MTPSPTISEIVPKTTHAVIRMLIHGFLYYRLTILELTLLVFLSWGAFVEADTMTTETWDKSDYWTKRRYRIGELIVIATAIKGFFSTSVQDAKKKQVAGESGETPVSDPQK